jgi:hypothetical protein
MSDSLALSKAYTSRDRAAMGGFKRIMGNSTAWHTQEFGFWVIMRAAKVNRRDQITFHYTKPQTDGENSEVTLTLPERAMVLGHCHTHPQRISTGNFSTGDKRGFEKLAKARSGIAYYLLNGSSEIRRAITAAEFPAGVVVNWEQGVTP